MMKVETILDQVDLGAMALPEFQRGYVWNRDQVRGLMFSLYRKHPVGSLLVWVTKTEAAKARGDGNLAPGTVKLLLDGQQRITSLYGIIRGKPPKFFDGNAQAFTGLYFNLDDETFEFFMPMKMKEYRYELKNPRTGESLAVLDLAWPVGLQEGLSQPVALILGEGEEMEEVINQAGFRFFTTVKTFKDYVQRDILAVQSERDNHV